MNNTGYKDGAFSSGLGEATLPKANVGELVVNFFSSPVKSTEPNYHILAVDPKKYSLVYSCETYFGVSRVQMAWILAREKTLDAATISHLEQVLKQNGGDPQDFIMPSQTDCPE